MEENRDLKNKIFLDLNLLLCFLLTLSLVLYLFGISFFREVLVLKIFSIVPTLVVFFRAIQSIKNRQISIDLLASVALAVSLYEGQWVGAIFINLMIASARAFVNYVQIKSHSAISSLMKLKPEKVKIEKNGKISVIPIGEVKTGDRVVVGLGELVPVDGKVERGEATINQSSLTGESLPISKKEGDEVLSSTTVVSGNLTILVEKVGKETTFEKIITLIEHSQTSKAPIHSLINKFANWYIILTISGSVLVYLISRDVNVVVGLLLVSCADDIAIATPLAFMSAVTHCARHGAIVKGGDYLEGLASLKTVVFDKTGTLTFGKLRVKEIIPFGKIRSGKILEMAAVTSLGSDHPIARAIVKFAKEKKIKVKEPERFEEHEGRGMSSFYRGKEILMGKPSFFKEIGIEMQEHETSEIEKAVSERLNVTLIASEKKLIGFIALSDEMKPRVKQTIEKLKALGVRKTVMLTGDNEISAKKVALASGIDEFHANLLPQDKLDYLKQYLDKKYRVAMVGDGVNDAPTIAVSDIGIAMGAIGSDAAMESADIVIMKDDLSQIPDLVKIGQSTMKAVRINLLLWGALNVFGFVLVFLHILNPSGAAAYNFVTDFIPIFNSLRLFK